MSHFKQTFELVAPAFVSFLRTGVFGILRVASPVCVKRKCYCSAKQSPCALKVGAAF